MTPINDDFEKEYKSDVWKGFALPELLSIGTAVVLMIVIMAVLIFGFDVDVSIALVVAMVPALPVLLISFGKSPEGDSLITTFKHKQFQAATRYLTYVCGEYESAKEDMS